MNHDEVMIALAEVIDPAGRRLVASNAVRTIEVEGDWVGIVLDGEQVHPALLDEVHHHLSGRLGATVELRAGGRTFRGGKGFGEGRHVIAVLGGKGGVGKSTVATNLGITLSAMGMSVGILDGDINAPDLPHLLGMRPADRPRNVMSPLFTTTITPPSQRPRPVERCGIEAWSVSFVMPENNAPAWSGRLLIPALLRYLLFDINWSVQVLLIDAPPGTGEEIQAMVRDLPLSAAVFVTTPQDLAQMDAARALTLLRDREIPVIGMVQNMASLICPHCHEPIDMFAQSERLANAGLDILGRIPFDVQLSVSADRGYPLVLGNPRGPIAIEFARIGAAVRRWLSNRNVTGDV